MTAGTRPALTGDVAPASGTPGRGSVTRWVLVSSLVLAACLIASVLFGSEPISPPAIVAALVDPAHHPDAAAIVLGLRIPRTVIGLIAGVSLGVSGGLMQVVTRNPLADPGLLGVNAGASLAVVVAITYLGVATTIGWVWFAFAGAAAAAVLVYAVGGTGRDGATPVKLALSGAAVSAAVISLVNLVLIAHTQTYTSFRFWSVGSLVARDLGTVAVVLPFVVAGLALAFIAARPLDLLALGDDVARGLGVRVTGTRLMAAAAVVLLCGGATSLAGPLVFVGLVAPHAARRLVGPGTGRLLVLSALIAPTLLIGADIAGRFIAPPGELEAGIVVAIIGAPVMIALVRSRTLVRL